MKRLLALPLLLLSLISCSFLDENTPNPDSEPEPSNSVPTVTLTASPLSGVAPLEVTFTATASDADGDDLSYSWSLEGAANAPTTSQTFTEASSYPVTVTVSDGQASATADVTVVVSESDSPDPNPNPEPNPDAALTVTASAGGPVPWGVTYELSASSVPTDSSFNVTCTGQNATNLSARDDIELEAENVFSCIHLVPGEAVVATLTDADGTVLSRVEQAADVTPSTGVPFGGAWEYKGQTGDTFLETATFTVTEYVNETTGRGSGGYLQELLTDYPEYPDPRPTTFTLSATGNTLTVTGPPTFLRELIFTGPVAPRYGSGSYQGAQVFMAPNTQERDSNQGFLYTAE